MVSSANIDSRLRRIRAVIAENIDRLMKEQSKTRRRMCSDLNLKYTTLCSWIKGTSTPKPEALAILSDYFDVDITEFYRDTNPLSNTYNRLSKYKEACTELSFDILKGLTDDQIKELLKKGFRFKHRTLEEYAALSGRPLISSGEIDFGEPVGDEIW